MFAEHPRIAKRWAHENPEGDEGLPTYAHGKTTSPDLKKRWERLKARRSIGKPQEGEEMKYSDKGVAAPSKGQKYAKKKMAGLSDLIKKAQPSGPVNVREASNPKMSCMTCKYFTPLSGNRAGPGMCGVGSRPVPVKGTDVSDSYESKVV
jgi:hypothetical protein